MFNSVIFTDLVEQWCDEKEQRFSESTMNGAIRQLLTDRRNHYKKLQKQPGLQGKVAEKEPNSAKTPSRRNSDSDSNSDEEVVTKKKKNPGHHVDSDEE